MSQKGGTIEKQQFKVERNKIFCPPFLCDVLSTVGMRELYKAVELSKNNKINT